MKIGSITKDPGLASVNGAHTAAATGGVGPRKAVIDPKEVVDALVVLGIADQMPDGLIVYEIGAKISSLMNDMLGGVVNQDSSFGSRDLDALVIGITDIMSNIGINSAGSALGNSFDARMGQYMDDDGESEWETDDFDSGKFALGVLGIAVGGPMAVGGTILTGAGAAGTPAGGIGVPAVSVGVGLTVIGGGLAWEGIKDVGEEGYDLASEVVEYVTDDEDGRGAEADETSSDQGAASTDDDSTEGFVFTEEEVAEDQADTEADADSGESSEDDSGDEDVEDDQDSGEDPEEEENNAEDEGFVFTEEEVADDESESDQTPRNPDSVDGGLSQEEFAEKISGPNYGSSNGAGTMQPGKEGYDNDVFVFDAVNYGSSNGVGVTQPDKEHDGLTPEELARVLSSPQYGLSNGPGVTTPLDDEVTIGSAAVGVGPEPIGPDVIQIVDSDGIGIF